MSTISESAADRHERLRRILCLWKERLAHLEESALLYFQEQNLERISELLAEKRVLEHKIQRLEEFLQTIGA